MVLYMTRTLRTGMVSLATSSSSRLSSAVSCTAKQSHPLLQDTRMSSRAWNVMMTEEAKAKDRGSSFQGNNHRRGDDSGYGPRARRYVFGSGMGVSLAAGAVLATEQKKDKTTKANNNNNDNNNKHKNIRTAITRLEETLGKAKVSTGTDVLEKYVEDYGVQHPKGIVPSCVVFPESTEDVSAVLRTCNDTCCPVVPVYDRAMTEGWGNLTTPGILIDMTKMNKILKVEEANADMFVQGGASLTHINKTLAERGSPLFFPLQGASLSSIGGMCCIDANGSSGVRYGRTRDYVLDLTVVLPSGEVVKTGCSARKNVAGYNLNSLFVGSEATLGVITEITLKLVPRPPAECVLVSPFPAVQAAAACVNEVMALGENTLSDCDLLDESLVTVLNSDASVSSPLTPHPTVLFKFMGAKPKLEQAVKRVEAIAKKYNLSSTPSQGVRVERGERAAQLWESRKDVAHRLEESVRSRYGGVVELWTSDVSVPLGEMPIMLLETMKDMKESASLQNVYLMEESASLENVYLMGRLGDGSFKVWVPVDKKDNESIRKAREACDRMYARALSHGGVCSGGEHGVGVARKTALMKQVDGPSYTLMQSLKTMMDPNNILNPGKVIELNYVPV